MSGNDVGGRRRFEDSEHTLHIYPGNIAEGTIYCPVIARKTSTAAEVIDSLINKLQLDKTKCYVLAEVKEFGGEEWILNPTDCPVQRMMLWPRMALENRLSGEDYRFLLREKNLDGSIHYASLQSWLQVTEERRRMMERGFLPQPQYKDYDDLCALPDLNERTLLENLRNRFKQEKIYTYVGSILIVINPFKFLPIYNPKYVKMYDNHQLGKLEPHIYAVADVAYHAMLQRRKNQCIVISGESGSGKTQSTNFLIHHLTALSQKGFASGVEQIILGAGPVLEAFGNAKTAHNNNSSRFGKFIQVNYQETGTVRGAYVEKYLLEKSRLVYQEHNERNYHVFYYLLAGASEEEKSAFHLKQPDEYHYLNQDCFSVEGEDLKHDFERLQLAMEMVGFLPKTRKQIFSILSAILHLGNICYKKKTYRDDSIDICNPEVLPIVSELLEVKEEMLFEALVTRKTVTVGEKLVLPYKLAEAVTVRNSMAKSLYSALFDWIVFRINHALLNTKDFEESTKTLSIGVLDIFGFEDYESNSFEQFCINFANERLQHYFNRHIFKLEQEEYRLEGISWHNIEYTDNSGCINLISKKPTGLLHLLDEESNFPQATNQTLLDKFKRQHEGNLYIEFPAVMEPAFIIKHYAGKVKYGVKDFREKNTDHMRPDIVALLRSSKSAFICGMIGIDPVAVFRWAVLRAFFRGVVAFREAGRRHIEKKTGSGGLLRCPGRFKSPWEGRHGGQRLSPPPAFRRGPGPLLKSGGGRKSLLPPLKSLKHLTNLTLHDRITKSLLHLHKKKKPPSISAQFQASLTKLMETLGQAEPYFVKCIRSNADKLPLRFSDNQVLRQLRYTGMRETVRIRQSGYSSKYTFKEFVDHFHVLLPRSMVPSKENIQEFLRKTKTNPDNYQVGRTMVFMKEQGRQLLQGLLHEEVLRRITLLQSWFRTMLYRRQFLNLKQAAVVIQSYWRECLRHRNAAATIVQAKWRSYHTRSVYRAKRNKVILLQAAYRGYKSVIENNLRNKRMEIGGKFLFPEAKHTTELDGAGQSRTFHGECPPSFRGQEGPASEMLSSDPVIKKLEKLNVEKEERQKQKQLQNEKEMMEQIRQQKEILGKQRKVFEQQNKVRESSQGASIRSPKKTDKPQSLLIGSPQSKEEPCLTTSAGPTSTVDIKGLTVTAKRSPPACQKTQKEKTIIMILERKEDKTPGVQQSAGRDQLSLQMAAESQEGSSNLPAREKRFRLPRIPRQGTESSSNETRGGSIFFTPKDSHNTLLLDATCVTLPFLELTPPRSPELSGIYRRECKENKEPSPKVKRKRSLKISNVTMEPAQWQNDALQIITSVSDLKSMDEFLLKKDCQKDTLVDVVFKKALKEFRQNILSFYSSALAVSCRVEEHNGHIFKATQYSIPTYCEFCSSLIWIMDKASVCKCKHETFTLTDLTDYDPELSSRQFGVELSRLTSEERTVPLVFEKLTSYIEMHALYTEGIYRKSGSTNKIKELRQGLDTDIESVNLDDYNIHVIASVFKQWLRDLPNPLMTFEFYEEFLRAMGLHERKEAIRGVYSVISQLSGTHLSTLERLIFHLVRIALEEETNRMSANALAIVFAPCVLRSPDTTDPLRSAQDVSKTIR
uniref:Myosin IXA n=1 Tax=Podarcis muralis TaxID=64176 RepID=A0A670JTP9_PODMU